MGDNSGSVTNEAGVEKICGIFCAYLCNCIVGNDVRISNVAVHLANYEIGDQACIENVGRLETRPGARFGNGVEIEPLNEGGGRELILFNRLDSQFAHLMCLHRYQPRLVEQLRLIALQEADGVQADRGTIGCGAQISNVKNMVDVCVGDLARIEGASSLVNGTVLSCEDDPTSIGTDVQADDFIIAEGAEVTGGAVVSKSFIGQGCRVGRQFSSEGSVFFANGEGFHGEACSVLAGPYSVTHHKSTLLIAGMFSFYNAGSGTNQSNHLYKLGPVHEGKLERGCKTGSFSYMMWPCRVGPFSVVLGKHTRNFDTADFPFSYIEASPEGRCIMTPGFNFTTVGTVRDGAKWPARDRRKAKIKRDRISFDVLSPFSVGRMIRGSARMKKLQAETDRAVEVVNIDGAEVKRVLLRTGQKTYRLGIHAYLFEKIVDRIEVGLDNNASSVNEALIAKPDAVFSQQWVDIGGQLMPALRIEHLCDAVDRQESADLDSINAVLEQAVDGYQEDEWAWVRWAYEQVFEQPIEAADMNQLADQFAEVRAKFLELVVIDASKEFDSVVRTGFGQDGHVDDAAADFAAVRGEFDTNKFVQQMQQEIAALSQRVEKFKQRVSGV